MLDTKSPIVSIQSPHSKSSVNRQPDSQLVKSLSTCVCVETVAHLRRNAVYCGHTFQLYCLCFCSSLSVRARLHEGEGTEEAGGWMDRSLLSLGFFLFLLFRVRREISSRLETVSFIVHFVFVLMWCCFPTRGRFHVMVVFSHPL